MTRFCCTFVSCFSVDVSLHISKHIKRVLEVSFILRVSNFIDVKIKNKKDFAHFAFTFLDSLRLTDNQFFFA